MAQNTAAYTFNGTGNGGEILVSGPFSVTVQGTFAATLVLERYVDDIGWVAIDEFSASASRDGYDEVGHKFRFRCSAYTSGAAQTAIEV